MLKLLHIFQKIRVTFYRICSNCKRANGTPKRSQPVLFLGEGSISIGQSVRLGFFPSPSYFSTYQHIESRTKESIVSIADDTMINNNFYACSEGAGIYIGKDCLIGTDVRVFDSDFHHLDPAKRKTGKPHKAPVYIKNNVFLGSGVTVCKGVTIGENSVVGAGAVVTQSIPANVIAAGNPAVVIREL